MSSEDGAPSPHPFDRLTPDFLLDALERIGLRGDGRLLALNSYENRVWQVGLEEGGSVVAKFYRPARWTTQQLMEEHAFALELAEAEVPVVAPQADAAGRTLHDWQGFHYAVFPRRGGRAPELDRSDVLERMGYFLGRLHSVGARQPFEARPTLGVQEFGVEPRSFLLDSGLIPDELRPAWAAISEQALDMASRLMEQAGPLASLRLHGDCHPGNVLWTDAGPHFVDLDDARGGPAVQDLWMLLSGARQDMEAQLVPLLRGYRAFRRFDAGELAVIEALRTLRLIHYSAWIARRWDDPAFPRNFPWFGGMRYWQDRVLELREQVGLMQEDPISAPPD